MGTLTGHNILDRQRDLVQDVDAVRWDDPEALRWLNDGIRDLITKKPATHTVHGTIALAPTVQQTITGVAGAFALADILFNTTSTGVPTTTIRRVELSSLTAINQKWPLSTGATVQHWASDTEPHTFFVYPALPVTGVTRYVDAVVATLPPDLTDLSQTIPVDDIWANTLGYYLAFRLYSKDSDGTLAPAATQAYYTLFTNSIGA